MSNKICPKCKMNFSDGFDECPYCDEVLIVGDLIEQSDEHTNILKMSDEEILSRYGDYRIKLESQIGKLSDYEFINGLKEAKRDSVSFSLNKIENENNSIVKPSPKCPTCSSTNIRKMSGIERGASIATFGLFSKKINKTFKCNGCGYTW